MSKDAVVFEKGLAKPFSAKIVPTGLKVGETEYTYEDSASAKRAFEILNYASTVFDSCYHLPWEFGGVSPKTLEEDAFDPFVRTQARYKVQPKGEATEGMPIRGGFDCAGIIRYVLGNFNIGNFAGKKKRVQEYFEEKDDAGLAQLVVSLAGKENYGGGVRTLAYPLDVIFTFGRRPDGSAQEKHISLYLGDGKVLESKMYKTPDLTNVPRCEWDAWEANKNPLILSDCKNGRTFECIRGGLQINDIEKTTGVKLAQYPELEWDLHVVEYFGTK